MVNPKLMRNVQQAAFERQKKDALDKKKVPMAGVEYEDLSEKERKGIDQEIALLRRQFRNNLAAGQSGVARLSDGHTYHVKRKAAKKKKNSFIGECDPIMSIQSFDDFIKSVYARFVAIVILTLFLTKGPAIMGSLLKVVAIAML